MQLQVQILPADAGNPLGSGGGGGGGPVDALLTESAEFFITEDVDNMVQE